MTKKFIHTDKTIHDEKVKSEFLIPDIYNGTKSFIGLTSLNTYDYGMIVYTGVSLDVDKIFDKASKIKSISFFKKNRARKKLKNYLLELKKLKIGIHVTFDSNGQLIEINLKKQYFKSTWEEDRTHYDENWGVSIWYFEIDHEGFPERQLEIYSNGKSLWYTRDKLDDEYGSLGDKAFAKEEFQKLLITKLEFEEIWSKKQNIEPK